MLFVKVDFRATARSDKINGQKVAINTGQEVFNDGKLLLFLINLQPISDEKSVMEDKLALKPDISLLKLIWKRKKN